MSKKTETTVNETTNLETTNTAPSVPMEMAHISALVSIPSDNAARHDLSGGYLTGDDDELAKLAWALSAGYNPALGLISARPLKDSKIGIDQRQADFGKIMARTTGYSYSYADDSGKKQTVTVSAVELADMYKRLFAAPVDGDAITWTQPKFRTVSGHRRTMALVLAQCFREKRGLTPEYQIPVHVTNLSDSDALLANIKENENKAEGNLSTSWREKIAAGMMLIKDGRNQSFIRSAYGDGTGQKIWHICRLLIELSKAGKDVSGLDDNTLKSLDKEATRKQVETLAEKREKFERASNSPNQTPETRQVIKNEYDAEVGVGMDLFTLGKKKASMLTAKILTENIETFAPHVQDVVKAILEGKLADLQAIKAL